jgi:hypothetical protein
MPRPEDDNFKIIYIYASYWKLIHRAEGKIKVNFALEKATKAQRGSRGIALPFL